MNNTNDLPYREADPDDTRYGGARDVVKAEIAHIAQWRDVPEPRAGIALSGGGIRSASFGLGVLQALAKSHWLREFDYLSTVSGGGYTGASLSYLLHLSRTTSTDEVPRFDVSADYFPYLSYPMVGASVARDIGVEREKGALLRRLRQNANYLAPGNGITALSLFGVILRNSVTSILVHGGLIVLALLVMIGVGFIEAGGPEWPPRWHMTVVGWFSVAILLGYAVLSGLYVIASGAFDAAFTDHVVYRVRRWYEKAVRLLLLAGIVCLVIAALPWLYAVAKQTGKIYSLYAGALGTFFGVVTSVWAFLQSGKVKKTMIPIGLVVAFASVLLLMGVVLLAFWLALHLEASGSIWTGAAATLVVLVVAGWIPNVNYLSVHRYYRDRLMETFMPDKDAIANPETPTGPSRTGNETMLGAICGVAETPPARDKDCGPYHLICANAVLVSSDNPRYRGRGGDSFVFSPLYTGSNATGWMPTDPTPGHGMTLATAMAISGAAVNPNTGCGGVGITRQPVLSVLMGMLNIRLGYWLTNPYRVRETPAERTAPKRSLLSQIFFKPNMLQPGIWESFGRDNLREKGTRYLLLTDGGHFENLGLYELLRRRLKLIVVCDGAADPDYAFGDLANALEKARADFGAIVDISSAHLDDLVPQSANDGDAKADSRLPVAKRPYLVAPIKYARSSSAAEATDDCGLLIYLTTTFFNELNASLHGYRQTHPAFPDEPTSDQFFDESQFESYRELGFQSAWKMMTELSATASETLVLGGVAFPRLAQKEAGLEGSAG